MTTFDERNQVLDGLIAGRRSIRAFTDQAPPREMIESIIKAAILAPFAGAAVGQAPDFRRFIVLPQGSKARESVMAMMSDLGRAQLEAMQGRAPAGAPFLQRLEALANGQIPGKAAPWLIILAELKGLPPVEKESQAHCLQNMWLKAVALDLGFQLVSALSMLTDEPRFWELCGLPAGKYVANGCAIGYAAVTPGPPRPLPTVDEATIWLD